MSTSPLQIDLPPAERLNALGYLPWVIILACAAALIVLISQLMEQIPGSLQTQARTILQSSHQPLQNQTKFNDIHINAHGRDLHLTGTITVGQSPASLLDSLAEIEGVRTVRDDLVVVDPVEVEAQKNRRFSQTLQSIDTSSVAFRAGSVEFSSGTEPALQALSDLMLENPDQRIRIEGHTDNTGPDAVNMRLSQERASAVANYLVSRGIAPERLIVKGYGSSQPISSNDSEDGRSRNRRIEISHVY